MEKIRIAKFIADSGITSRRGAESLINRGHVCVNGNRIDNPVIFVDENDVITVGGTRVTARKETQLYAFHKPINTITSSNDPQGRRTIYDCLPLKYKNLKYIGRLDFRTTGLLLLTNDGELARQLTLPESDVPRVYIATVAGTEISGLDAARRGMTVDGVEYQPMKIDVISRTPNSTTLRICLTEGKKNEIRVALRECGNPVRKLHRVSYGCVKLGKLPVGKICQLDQKVIDELLKTN